MGCTFRNCLKMMMTMKPTARYKTREPTLLDVTSVWCILIGWFVRFAWSREETRLLRLGTYLLLYDVLGNTILCVTENKK